MLDKNGVSTLPIIKRKVLLPEYRIWATFIQRCTNKSNRNYISDCKIPEAWIVSFEEFLNDVGRRPSKDHCLERPDKTKGFSPDNIQWAPKKPKVKRVRINSYSHPVEYRAWQGLLNKHATDRMVTVCESWYHSFQNFFRDMGPRPSPHHTLQPIVYVDEWGPGNVFWKETKSAIAGGRAPNTYEAFGKAQTLQQWAEDKEYNAANLSLTQLRNRVYSGWPLEYALCKRKGKAKTVFTPEGVLLANVAAAEAKEQEMQSAPAAQLAASAERTAPDVKKTEPEHELLDIIDSLLGDKL